MKNTVFVAFNVFAIIGALLAFPLSMAQAEVIELKGHTEPVSSAFFSPDGIKIVTAGGHDRTFRIWCAYSGKELRQFKGHERYVGFEGYPCYARFAAFSPDGKKIATTGDDAISRIRDAQSGAILQTLEGHEKTVLTAVFSLDGKRIVTAGFDNTARIWDAESGKELQTLEGHLRPLMTAVFSHDGKKVVTASDDCTARIWDVDSGQELYTLTGHTSQVYSAAFSPDGSKVVTASIDGTVRIWDTVSGRELEKLITNSVTAVEFRNLDFFLLARLALSFSGFANPTSPFARLPSPMEFLVANKVQPAVLSASFSPDGTKIVSTTTNRTAYIWDADSGRMLQTLKGHTGWVNSAVFSPDGKKIVTTDDRTARMWILE